MQAEVEMGLDEVRGDGKGGIRGGKGRAEMEVGSPRGEVRTLTVLPAAQERGR